MGFLSHEYVDFIWSMKLMAGEMSPIFSYHLSPHYSLSRHAAGLLCNMSWTKLCMRSCRNWIKIRRWVRNRVCFSAFGIASFNVPSSHNIDRTTIRYRARWSNILEGLSTLNNLLNVFKDIVCQWILQEPVIEALGYKKHFLTAYIVVNSSCSFRRLNKFWLAWLLTWENN